jgi:hypothetical protein
MLAVLAIGFCQLPHLTIEKYLNSLTLLDCSFPGGYIAEQGRDEADCQPENMQKNYLKPRCAQPPHHHPE